MSSEITPERIAEGKRLLAVDSKWGPESDADADCDNWPLWLLQNGADLIDEIERLRHALEVSQEIVDRLVDEAEKKDSQLAKAEAEIQIARRERSVLMGCMEHFTDEQLEAVPDGKLVAALRIMTEADQAADYHTWADGVLAQNKEKDAEIEKLQERIDLDVDEFQRIKAELDPLLVGLHGTMPEAISKCVAVICDRAITAGRQRVPLIEQRDRAEAESRRLRVANDNLRALLPKAFDAGKEIDLSPAQQPQQQPSS